jgi:hypothetical protein
MSERYASGSKGLGPAMKKASKKSPKAVVPKAGTQPWGNEANPQVMKRAAETGAKISKGRQNSKFQNWAQSPTWINSSAHC